MTASGDTPKKRKPRVDGSRTREALMEAAEAEFAEKGYELGSVREISRRAGANAALANRYFGTKEEMYRTVAKRLFGDLGAPLATLHEKVTDDASWRLAVREWVDDFLFMSLPTEAPQKLCSRLFCHEVTNPTPFHAEFRETFGRPVYEGLRKLLAMKIGDEEKLDLWTTSVWSQVSIYALADEKWHSSFRPKGMSDREWAAKVGDHICGILFASIDG